MRSRWPVLSFAERDRRWNNTKRLMETEGVECLIVPGLKGREAYEGYLSNDYAEGIVVFPRDGDPVHLTWTGSRITRRWEDKAQGAIPWIDDMRVGAVGPGLAAVLKEKGLERGAIGVLGLETRGPGEPEGCLPYTTWAYVLKELKNAEFKEVSSSFAEMTLVKSEEEMELMRFSAGIGEDACEKMLDCARPGVSEREIYSAIMEVVFQGGAFPPAPFLILHSGGENLSWGPSMWIYRGGPTRILEAGDLVQAEIFPKYGGMESQQQMSIHLAPEKGHLLELGEVARKSYDAGLAAMKPGISFREVCEAMEAPLEDAQCWHLTPLIHSLAPLYCTSATGVGIENVAEQFEGLEGRLKSRGISGGDVILREGMVFELEPNACKGRYRVNIGGTVFLGKGGPEELNRLPTRMQIKN